MQEITLELYLLSNFNIAKSNYKFAYMLYKKNKNLVNLSGYYLGVLRTNKAALLKAAFDLKHLKVA